MTKENYNLGFDNSNTDIPMGTLEREPNNTKSPVYANGAPSQIPNNLCVDKQDEPSSPTNHDPNDLEWEFEDEDVGPPNFFMKFVTSIQDGLNQTYNKYKTYFRYAIGGIILVGFHIYLGFAIWYSLPNAVGLLALTCIAWFFVIYYKAATPLLEKQVDSGFRSLSSTFGHYWEFAFVRWAVYVAFIAALVTFLAIDTRNDRSRLISFGGLLVYILLLFVFSANPARVKWRPVIWGLGMQFCLGILVLRWKTGSLAFRWASDKIVAFLDFTNAGTEFVYGFLAKTPPQYPCLSPVFVFTVLQVVIYFGAIVSVLYFLGIMQAILTKIAWVMQLTMGTTAAESLNAAACIFLGQSEAPLLIKPYLVKMTNSEIHAVMTAGFACIAGSLFAAYISFGACPSYLLSATVMSAPAALAVSKLFYPETKKSKLKRIEDLHLPPSEENNALEAISNGAVNTTELVWAITANLIVFLALLAFVDVILSWIGGMIGHPEASFELIMGYVFYPLAYIMGAGEDSIKVAELMGTKTILNEFIAFQRLGKLVQEGALNPKSQMLATYALCGFSNISSIGIQLGTIGGLCPEKKPVIAKIALRALVAGCFACFMTACIAGVLVEVPEKCTPRAMASNCTMS